MRISAGKNGLVLVAVLWAVALLMVIIAAVSRTSRLDTKLCLAATEELQCKWACRAGIETAVAVLNEDIKTVDNLMDPWADNDEDFNDVIMERSRFDVWVVDEASKLNVNTATKKQLLLLPEMTAAVADSIIDWRDKDDEPGPDGAGGGCYENLRYRYRIRNGNFKTIRELLLVKGVTAELLYGEDTNFNGRLDYNENDGGESIPADNKNGELDKGWIAYLTCYSYEKNKDAAGNERVNINEADENTLETSLKIKKPHAKWIVENRKKGYKSIADLINDKSPKKAENRGGNPNEAKPLDLETYSSIVDKIKISKDETILGKVNINTASKIVLAALLGGGDKAEQLADSLIAYRDSSLNGFESIADLINSGKVKISAFKKIADQIAVRSGVYNVFCSTTAERNKLGGWRQQTEAVVDRGQSPCKMLYWYQGVSN